MRVLAFNVTVEYNPTSGFAGKPLQKADTSFPTQTHLIDKRLFFLAMRGTKQTNIVFFTVVAIAQLYFFIRIPSSSPAATSSTTTIPSQANKPFLPDIIFIQTPLDRRLK